MKRNNVKIAITGGIGSGKSTALKILRSRGNVVFSCDEIYSELLNYGELTKKIAELFGEEVIDRDGKLNRGRLSEIVFADEEKLKLLNSLTHREIMSEMLRRGEEEKGVVYFEVPLLFEGKFESLFDGVVVLLRDENVRISSVCLRDGVSEESVKKRIIVQHNYEISDYSEYYVIHNNGNIDNLEQNILEIDAKIKSDFQI